MIGLGRSGIASIRLLQKMGVCFISAMEKREDASMQSLVAQLAEEGVEVILGTHERTFLKGKDLIVTSPGVPWDRPPLSWAQEEGIPVIGEIELASRYCRGRILAVTGTNGKSTTVSLIHHILQRAGMPSLLCGNIGEPFSDKTLSVRPEAPVVLEVSSFQLLGCVSFHPSLAVILNVTPNHLDWHADFESYCLAKRRIFQNQGPSDRLCLNLQDPILRGLEIPPQGPQRLWFGRGDGGRGVFAKGEWLVSTLQEKEEGLFRLCEIPLLGDHNVTNVSAAVLTALCEGISPEAIREGVRTFRALEHRLERVATFQEVTFVNDSKATTVESVRQALLSFSGPILLIAGGRDKGGDFESIRDLLSQKVRKLFLIGEARPKMERTFVGCVSMAEAEDLDTAVEKAAREARPGEVVLLSPMCASFDQFEDFEARGRAFKEAVRRVTGKEPRCVTKGVSYSSSS